MSLKRHHSDAPQVFLLEDTCFMDVALATHLRTGGRDAKKMLGPAIQYSRDEHMFASSDASLVGSLK